MVISDLINLIDTDIATNGVGAITGAVANSVLKEIANSAFVNVDLSSSQYIKTNIEVATRTNFFVPTGVTWGTAVAIQYDFSGPYHGGQFNQIETDGLSSLMESSFRLRNMTDNSYSVLGTYVDVTTNDFYAQAGYLNDDGMHGYFLAPEEISLYEKGSPFFRLDRINNRILVSADSADVSGFNLNATTSLMTFGDLEASIEGTFEGFLLNNDANFRLQHLGSGTQLQLVRYPIGADNLDISGFYRPDFANTPVCGIVDFGYYANTGTGTPLLYSGGMAFDFGTERGILNVADHTNFVAKFGWFDIGLNQHLFLQGNDVDIKLTSDGVDKLRYERDADTFAFYGAVGGKKSDYVQTNTALTASGSYGVNEQSLINEHTAMIHGIQQLLKDYGFSN